LQGSFVIAKLNFLISSAMLPVEPGIVNVPKRVRGGRARDRSVQQTIGLKVTVMRQAGPRGKRIHLF
jgi:hypothetical protein